MELLFSLPALPAQAVREHLTLWFNRPAILPPQGEPLVLVLGQAADLPRGFAALQARFPDRFFSHPPFFALALGFSTWPGLSGQIAQEAPDFFEALAEALQPKPATFRLLDREYLPQEPQVMGILNLTPDSFYDGGQYNRLEAALDRARTLVEEGADLLDLGGESTRPGSEPVSVQEELNRVLPVLRAIRERWQIPLSIDTTKPQVAQAALAAGASLVNDVSGLSGGKEMVEVVNQAQAGYVLMHTQGQPRTMQQNPSYQNPVIEVYRFFQDRLDFCSALGLNRNRILLDPGIGFGKLLAHNLELLRMAAAFTRTGSLTLLGTSNKSFLAKALGLDLEERAAASLATQVLGLVSQASFFRVHQVKETKQALALARLYRSFGPS